MSHTLERPRLGDGIYTFREAARILRGVADDVSTRQLRYWMKTGLTPASFQMDEDGGDVLSFADLVSLELVRRLRMEGASLQSIRKVEEYLRGETSFDRPLAHEVFFTDGADVWVQVHGERSVVLQLTGRRRNHFAWKDAIATFATNIQFEGPDRRASRWKLSPWVEIDPAIQYGAPVVRGSRVPVRTIAANLKAGSPSEVADWYGLRVEQVVGVKDYLNVH